MRVESGVAANVIVIVTIVSIFHIHKTQLLIFYVPGWVEGEFSNIY